MYYSCSEERISAESSLIKKEARLVTARLLVLLYVSEV